ncbi:MAG: prephenate dehydratase [Deltaproteobacteria bacterium]|nr:prephenate dehydratase [Deltaproteobacteria bacterium]
MKSLEALRKKIDDIDSQILTLLSERGKVAQLIGKIKKEGAAAVHVPSREKKVFDRVAKANQGPYKTESVIAIFREIISATRALEAPLKISYLGPAATFTHMAAVSHFGSSAEMVPTSGIQAIFDDVEKGHSDYGVVPIENTTEGVVSHTLDLFADFSLQVCAEVVVRVSHHLLSAEADLQKIKKVYSHPHALAQCRMWLSRNIPHAVLKETESTAAAAQKAAHEKGAAAIASSIASSVYGLPIAKKEIQDQPHNFTRFLVIGSHAAEPTGRDKTSILFTIRDEVGGLHKVLAPLAEAGVNLTKIESRPLKKKAWEYMFFVDLDGHVNDSTISSALDQVKKMCVVFKIIGSYPKSGFAA